jgi:hypothetical protein
MEQEYKCNFVHLPTHHHPSINPWIIVFPVHTHKSILSSMKKTNSHPWKVLPVHTLSILSSMKMCYLFTHYPSYHPWKELPVHTLSILSSMKSVTCPHIIHPTIHENSYLSTHYASYHPWKVLPVDIPFIQPSIHPSILDGALWWVLLVLAREATKEGRKADH